MKKFSIVCAVLVKVNCPASPETGPFGNGTNAFKNRAAAGSTFTGPVERFPVSAAAEGKTVAGYGAPGKGNTLLNHCGIRTDLLAYTVDRSPHKHGLFLPGTHIPIHAPEQLARTRPDYILVLPWNERYVEDHVDMLADAIAESVGRLSGGAA